MKNDQKPIKELRGIAMQTTRGSLELCRYARKDRIELRTETIHNGDDRNGKPADFRTGQ